MWSSAGNGILGPFGVSASLFEAREALIFACSSLRTDPTTQSRKLHLHCRATEVSSRWCRGFVLAGRANDFSILQHSSQN